MSNEDETESFVLSTTTVTAGPTAAVLGDAGDDDEDDEARDRNLALRYGVQECLVAHQTRSKQSREESNRLLQAARAIKATKGSASPSYGESIFSRRKHFPPGLHSPPQVKGPVKTRSSLLAAKRAHSPSPGVMTVALALRLGLTVSNERHLRRHTPGLYKSWTLLRTLHRLLLVAGTWRDGQGPTRLRLQMVAVRRVQVDTCWSVELIPVRRCRPRWREPVLTQWSRQRQREIFYNKTLKGFIRCLRH